MANNTAFRLIDKTAQRTFKKDFGGLTGLQFNLLYDSWRNKLRDRSGESMERCLAFVMGRLRFNTEKHGRGVYGSKLYSERVLEGYAAKLIPLFECAMQRKQVETKKEEIRQESAGNKTIHDMKSVLHMVHFEPQRKGNGYYLSLKINYDVDRKIWVETVSKNGRHKACYTSGFGQQFAVPSNGYVNPKEMLKTVHEVRAAACEFYRTRMAELDRLVAAAEQSVNESCGLFEE